MIISIALKVLPGFRCFSRRREAGWDTVSPDPKAEPGLSFGIVVAKVIYKRAKLVKSTAPHFAPVLTRSRKTGDLVGNYFSVIPVEAQRD